jgi:alpha-D-xyloside xylohydrolase
MKKHSLYVLILCFVAISCKQAKYEKNADGVTIHLKKLKETEAKLLRIKVITDNIIRVTASPADSFSSAKSIMALDKIREKTDWQLEKGKDEIAIKTSALKVTVSLNTGGITFTDTTGKTILSESTSGRSFVPVKLDNLPTYNIKQVFESPDDEAFYGLGQHQNGLMNYKGKDVDLTQYNTVAVIPFVISSYNYGILWDNYSITKFGDSRQYQPLSSLKLYTRDGVAGGLTAKYLMRNNPEQVIEQRSESTIEYEFLKDMKKFPPKFNLNEGMVVWEGFLESENEGINKLLLMSAGYTKVWLDNKLVVDKWRQCWNPNKNQLLLNMETGKRYPIKIEWIPDGGESFIAMQALPPMDQEEQNKLSLFSEAGDQIDYYFIYGNNADDVISGYRNITGKATLLPKWAMGLWQSRERYKTQDELLDVVKQFRTKKIPLDNIVLDWQYWRIDQWGSHEFDSARFPDAKAMISDLHNKYNTQLMISVWPKFYVGTKHYDIMNSKGYLYTQNVLNNQKDWIGYVSTFYDAYNPDARKLFWNFVNEKLFSIGIDGWWLDATEPDILSNISVQDRKDLMKPNYLKSPSKYFNTFSVVNAMGVYDGQREANPDQRVFILTRSAYAGIQRYASATWSGDIGSRWEELKLQIPAGINFSLSGTPYWTTDIGGFAVEKRYENPSAADLAEWRELMTRWFQFGTFCPLFRVHGQFPFREMYNIAPDNHAAFKAMLSFNKLRYRLMPYIYSLAGKTYFDDYTIMRGLVMDFNYDTNIPNITDEFMFGPSLLICPVYQYKATSREVYLPANTGWYELFTGTYYNGGKTIQAEAPIEKIPIFVKEGSILPFGPDIQYTTEKKADPITLYVYTGSNGSFDLYEDENLNYNYEKGAYSIIPVSFNQESKTLTIGERKGSFPGMLPERTFRIIWVTKDTPASLNYDAATKEIIKYTGKAITIKQ